MGQIQEGYSLQISPLLSQDEQTIDAVVKCYIDQVEKLVPVTVEVPVAGGQRQACRSRSRRWSVAGCTSDFAGPRIKFCCSVAASWRHLRWSGRAFRCRVSSAKATVRTR